MNDVVVVGGGLAGLSAAALLARSGRVVELLEKGAEPGGRATTQVRDGFHFNQGAHALYHSHGRAVLEELGIVPTGGMPKPDAVRLASGGTIAPIPAGPASMIASTLFTAFEKIELARVFAALFTANTRSLASIPMTSWLDEHTKSTRVRAFLETLARVSTYCNDLDAMSAGSTISNMVIAARKNVVYLDGGWQTMVDALRARAETSGVRIRTHARVTSIERDAAGIARAVRLADDERLEARAFVIALPPAAARELVAIPETPPPLRAASLDLALRTLPNPDARVVLDLDHPLYVSAHSSFAKLAPAGGAIIHAMKYLPAGCESDPDAEKEIEAFLDRTQPGWRDVIVHRRFVPHLTVAGARVDAASGGLDGRPPVEHEANVMLAGDWVGPQGQLADASFASAREAARVLEERLVERAA